jgi:hypothetical protein
MSILDAAPVALDDEPLLNELDLTILLLLFRLLLMFIFESAVILFKDVEFVSLLLVVGFILSTSSPESSSEPSLYRL